MSKISHILLRNPVVISTGVKLSDAIKHMNKAKVSSILIKEESRLAGIISVEDIINLVAEGADLDIAVEEVMHFPEISINSEEWLSDAIAIFERCNSSHITVIENGENIAIMRAGDVLHTYRFSKDTYKII